MANPSITYTLVNGTANDAGPVNTNFSDIIAALTDGTKSLTIAGLTCTSLTSSGNIAGAAITGTTITGSGAIAGTTITGSGALSGTRLHLSESLAVASAPTLTRLYTNNIPKAFGVLTLGAAGAVTVTDGYNIASASYSSAVLTVNFHTNMTNATYMVLGNWDYFAGGGPTTKGMWFCPRSKAQSNFTCEGRDSVSSGNGSTLASGLVCNVVVFGA